MVIQLNEKMKTIIHKFRENIQEGHPVYGPFMKTCDPAFVEITGYAGF